MKNVIAQVVVGLPVPGPFDYLIPPQYTDKIAIGTRVRVTFGPQKCVGYVVGLLAKSRYPKERLKMIHELLDTQPSLNGELLKLTREVAEYYGCSLGEVIESALPEQLRRGQCIELPPLNDSPSLGRGSGGKEISLVKPVLLYDPLEEKSWDYLFEAVESALQQKQGVVFLVPDMATADQACRFLRARLSQPIAVLDRHAKEHLEHWLKIRAGELNMVIGSRSAVFAPVDRLGLMIVYDEENFSYKQEQSPYYHARDVALMRSRLTGARVILVSRCPSLESWSAAEKKKYELVSFPVQKKGADLQIVDLTNYKSAKMGVLSVPLRDAVEKTLARKEKVLLFLNRKGFSTLATCEKCHFILKCPRCATSLVYLFVQKTMVCRHCNYREVPPAVCPECQGAYLRFLGLGTEKLESEMARLFPQYRVSRLDKDTHEFKEDFDILIATQAILKFSREIGVAVVGVFNIDAELNRPDLHGAHKVFTLLSQLRYIAREKVIVQTRLATNACLKAAAKDDWKLFCHQEFKLRRELKLPPFYHLISVIVRGRNQQTTAEQADLLYQQLKNVGTTGNVEIFDPHPDILPKLRDKYRYIILLKGKSVKAMLAVLRGTLKAFKRKAGVLISVNVDP